MLHCCKLFRPPSRMQDVPAADLVADTVPRLLINREVVGEAAPGSRRGFDFSDDSRDGAFVGDCDQAVQALVQLLGWEAEMQALMDAGPRCRV